MAVDDSCIYHLHVLVTPPLLVRDCLFARCVSLHNVGLPLKHNVRVLGKRQPNAVNAFSKFEMECMPKPYAQKLKTPKTRDLSAGEKATLY